MATKTLTGVYSAGYALSPSYSTVQLTASAEIEGSGLSASASATVNNTGRILAAAGSAGDVSHRGGTGATGVRLAVGGGVINFSTIAAGSGGEGYKYGGAGGLGAAAILLGGTGSITNHGRVLGGAGGAGGGPLGFMGVGGAGGGGGAGIDIAAGGALSNGGLVQGGTGGEGGYGYDTGGDGGHGGSGVYLAAGGRVTNTNGTIAGGAGGTWGDGYYNFAAGGHGGEGLAAKGTVALSNGGAIEGGRGGDGSKAGLGGDGVLLTGGAIDNSGTVAGGDGGSDRFSEGPQPGASGGSGVILRDVGTVTNTGGISGGAGGYGGSGYSGVNGNPDGGVGGAGGEGLLLSTGGALSNRGAVAGGAGGAGGDSDGGNAGAGGAGGVGVQLLAGGLVVNLGSITGGAGGAGGNAPDGGSAGAAGSSGVGVLLVAGGSLTNGSSNFTRALVTGAIGVYGGGTVAATVTNFGTIQGTTESVKFGSAKDVLIAESGAQFIGAIAGGGGTFELAGGSGSITGLGTAAVMAGTDSASFSGFASYEITAGPWTLTGTNQLGPQQRLIDQGRLTINGAFSIAAGALLEETGSGVVTINLGAETITNAGSIESTGPGGVLIQGALDNTGHLLANRGAITVTGAVSGGGVADILGATLALGSSFDQNVAFTTASPSGVLQLAKSQLYAGKVYGFSKSGSTKLDLRDIAFVNANEASFSGDSSGGTLTVTDGVHSAHISLAGDYLGAPFVASSDGHGGVTIMAMSGSRATGFASAMAGFAASGAETHHGLTKHDYAWSMGLSAPRIMQSA